MMTDQGAASEAAVANVNLLGRQIEQYHERLESQDQILHSETETTVASGRSDPAAGQTSRNKPYVKPVSENNETSVVKFGWEEIENGLLLAYIKRGKDNFVAEIIYKQVVFKQILKFFTIEFINCVQLKTEKMTHIEASGYNDINQFHTNGKLVGAYTFRPGENLLYLDDIKTLYKFCQICLDLIVYKKPNNDLFGFLELSNGSSVPFIYDNDKKLVPLFFFDGQSEYLYQRSVAVEDPWKLAYLKFCCKVQKLKKSLYEKEAIDVVGFENVKELFEENVTYTIYFPKNVNCDLLTTETLVAILNESVPKLNSDNGPQNTNQNLNLQRSNNGSQLYNLLLSDSQYPTSNLNKVGAASRVTTHLNPTSTNQTKHVNRKPRTVAQILDKQRSSRNSNGPQMSTSRKNNTTRDTSNVISNLTNNLQANTHMASTSNQGTVDYSYNITSNSTPMQTALNYNGYSGLSPTLSPSNVSGMHRIQPSQTAQNNSIVYDNVGTLQKWNNQTVNRNGYLVENTHFSEPMNGHNSININQQINKRKAKTSHNLTSKRQKSQISEKQASIVTERSQRTSQISESQNIDTGIAKNLPFPVTLVQRTDQTNYTTHNNYVNITSISSPVEAFNNVSKGRRMPNSALSNFSTSLPQFPRSNETFTVQTIPQNFANVKSTVQYNAVNESHRQLAQYPAKSPNSMHYCNYQHMNEGQPKIFSNYISQNSAVTSQHQGVPKISFDNNRQLLEKIPLQNNVPQINIHQNISISINPNMQVPNNDKTASKTNNSHPLDNFRVDIANKIIRLQHPETVVYSPERYYANECEIFGVKLLGICMDPLDYRYLVNLGDFLEKVFPAKAFKNVLGIFCHFYVLNPLQKNKWDTLTKTYDGACQGYFKDLFVDLSEAYRHHQLLNSLLSV